MTISAILNASSQLQADQIMSIKNDENRRTNPAEAMIQFRTCEAWPDAKYYLALPETLNQNTPVLVSVHGISRNAREHAQTFARYCNSLGWAVVAPLFTSSRFPRYQQLGFARKGSHPRSDMALNAILDDVTELTGTCTDRVYMFGYSGGGQFVHRYAMTTPHRVIAAVLGVPGWFTFPNQGVPFPRGLRVNAHQDGLQLDWQCALDIPTAVFVGAQDLDRDESLNTAQKIDDQQGRTRPERGRRWSAAMRAAARFHGLDTRHEFCELEGCGHSFADCISIGRLDVRALDFLIRARIPATTLAAQRRHTSSLSFLA